MTKELSHVMLESHNMKMKPLNVRKKSKGTTKCEKRTVTFDKNRTYAMLVLLNITMEPSNVRKKLSHAMLELHNVRMKPSNVRKKIKRHQM